MRNTTNTTDSIAIAHKDYAVAGGGEIVAERLGRTFDAPVFAGFVEDSNRPDHIGADVRDLWGDRTVLGRLIKRGGATRQAAYKYLWRRCEPLRKYDTVVQSGFEPLWYVPRDTQTTVAYLHSTPRMQYDMYAYQHDQIGGGVRDTAGDVIAAQYNDKVRSDTLEVSKYPDLWVANSDLVARRVRRYYGVPEERTRVVYPPVATDDLGPRRARPGYDGTFLSLNRLDDWKRIDEVVDAFRELDQELLIAGKGPAEADLKERADDCENIRFLGYVAESEKRDLLASVDALVYSPLNEDFGMTPIEAVASGTPVISVNDGFQQFQLTDGENAILYDRDIGDRDTTVRNLRAAVRRFVADGVRGDPEALAAWAEQFSVARFETEMRQAVRDAQDLTSIKTEIADVPTGDVEPPEQPVGPAVADGGEPDGE